MAGWVHCQSPEIAEKRAAAIRLACQSEEVKRRKSEAAKRKWADPEFREKMRRIQQERWTPEQRLAQSQRASGRRHTEDHKAHMREVMKGKNVGKVRSADTRRKLSEAGLRSYRNGRPIATAREKIYRNSPGWHGNTWFRCLNSEGVAARQLDQVGIDWIYEPKRFKLSVGTYTPDFYIPEFDIWLEVKGYLRRGESAKIEAFRRETGKTLVLVMQTELEAMKY
jgi:hypothetical protein